MDKVRGEKALLSFQQGKNTWPAVALGIDETSKAVQLKGFFGKTIYF